MFLLEILAAFVTFVGLVYLGGYLWYRFVKCPWTRHAMKHETVIEVGAFKGRSMLVRYDPADWRPATFREWSRSRGECSLWPRRTFIDDEELGRDQLPVEAWMSP